MAMKKEDRYGLDVVLTYLLIFDLCALLLYLVR
jgi:hypothetical protein